MPSIFPDPGNVGNAMTSPGSTSAPALGVQMLGKTADGTPAYKPLPLIAGGASMSIAGAVTQSGSWTVAGTGNFTVVNGGTFAVQAAQSGTWNITNISGTISLPTGAATASGVSALQVAQGSSTSGQSGYLSQAAVTTAAPTYSTTQTSPLSLDTAGNLRVLSTTSSTSPPTNLTLTESRVRSGQAYIVSTGPQNLSSILGGNFNILLSNPTGSGKTCYVYNLVTESTAAVMVFATAIAIPTTGLPTTAITPNNIAFTGGSAVTTFKWNVSATAMGGGTTFATIGAPPNVREIKNLYKIPAGVSIGILVAFGATTVTANFTCYFWEE